MTRHFAIGTGTLLLLLSPLLSTAQQAGHFVNRDQASIATFAESAAVRAVNFRQGDAPGFARNQSNFTDNGWKDFIKVMQPFLDEKGAPTFTSTFIESGKVEILDDNGSIVRVRIPGSLTQSNKLGTTTYRRAALEVSVVEQPLKLQKLEQITCLQASTACD